MPLTDAMVGRPADYAEQTVRAVRVQVRERSHSDETVTVENAVTVSTVVAIITVMSQDMSSIPLLLYARRGRAKFRAYDSMYYRLMHDRPNPEHTSMTFRELIVGHLIAWGNFYAQKIWNDSGDITELWPLRPDRMTVERKDGQKIYRYRTTSGDERIFFSDEVLHIPGFGFDGLIGYSRIALARNAIGLSMSTEKFGAKFFANGANPGVVIQHPKSMSEAAYKHLKESWEQEHKGVENSHRFAILEEGATIDKIGIPPEDAQFIETRKFQSVEINKILGPLPPHMIGEVERSTSWGTGIDSQEQGYINHTLFPYGVRIEQNLTHQLLLERDREGGLFYEHLFDAFLRGDITTRFESYVKAINNGIMSPNEARAKENMNPYKEGDVYWRPANMLPVNEPVLTPAQPDASNALAPLWQDAVARVMKREQNDLLGASKRWQLKGHQEEFIRWAETFYRRDHPAFMAKQFKPLLDAQFHLCKIDASHQMAMFVTDLLDARLEQVRTLNAEQIADGMELYIASSIDGMMDVIRSWSQIPRNEFKEFEYEQ